MLAIKRAAIAPTSATTRGSCTRRSSDDARPAELTRLRELTGLLRGSRRLIWVSVALAVLQSALLVPVALLVRYAFDTLIPADRTGRLVLPGVAALALYLASAGVGVWTRYLVLGVTKRAVTDLRAQLFDRLHVLPRSWFDARDHATVHS